ncbi:PREDICTED: ribonuclease kappa, partial [Acanthisitta chloris]|uniref:ribonuclease kappa n=1 Tax=Acanthisitta chloris TaxID=57068 RepID=UPI0004F0F9FC
GPERIYGLYEQVSYNCFIAAGLYALLGGFSLCQSRLNKRKDGPERIYGLYEQVSYNCFIAAGLYALLGGFSLCQSRLNKRKEYMVR